MPEFDYTTLGKLPVSEASPTGENIQYDPDFEWLEEEIVKLTKPVLQSSEGGDGKNSGGSKFVYEQVNWDKVIETSSRLLQEKSKDLRLVAWLTRGLSEQDGIKGMASGIDVCLQIINEHWEAAFPARSSVRSMAIKRMCDFVLESIDGGPGTDAVKVAPDALPELERVIRMIDELDEQLTDKLPDQPVMMGLLQKALESKLAKARTAAAPPPPPPIPQATVVSQPAITPTPQTAATPAGAASAAAGAPPAAVAGTFDFDQPSQRSDYFRSLAAVARLLHTWGVEKAPEDPIPYRWIRAVLWSSMQFGADTQFLPMSSPNQMMQDNLRRLYDGGQWAELLRAAERAFSSQFHWLETQRYVIEAMDQLGPAYTLARTAVVLELTFLLRRMPHFVSLPYQDKIPVATPETQAWLQEITAGGVGDSSPASEATSVEVSISDDQEQPISFDQKDNVLKNMEKARQSLLQAHGSRQMFIIQLKLAEYLIKKKEANLAYSSLDEMDRQIAQYQLERWEPQLAVQALGLLHTCSLQMSKQDKHEQQTYLDRSRALMSRIVAIDPLLAAHLSSGKGKRK